MNDHAYMRRALELAARATGRTRPNPVVGCVLVQGDEVVGVGWHERAGGPHAEVAALRDAGERARGATAFVNLEPCSHHGRTPPCVDALIQAGVSRVVVGTVDPNPQVSGRGIQRLRDAGIEVETGVEEAQCQTINRPFFKHIRTGLPFVVAKWAMSLDGKIATHTGSSQWITGVAARERVHLMRDRLDAILVGSGTARADDPMLTCRIPGGRDPVRVLLDSSMSVSADARIFATPGTLVFCAVSPEASQLQALNEKGAEVIVVPRRDGKLDLNEVLRELGRRDITSLLVEGGAGVLGSFFDQGLVDQVACFIAPKIVGGQGAPGPIAGLGIGQMSEALGLQNVTFEHLGDDWLILGDVEARCSQD
jgi:diaminohydroxyphosphoribosylaminopyrimidine deaminase/5-amino-6-(5-phosphoribosylamino)uracil reductase